MEKLTNFSLGIAFFLSGIAAILYEILWVRLLSLSFGGVALVVAEVTSLFLAGLAVGGVMGGKLADWAGKTSLKKVILVYSLIELAIAILGFLNFQILIKFPYTPGLWREPVAFFLVFLQSLIAGATWPVMFKIFLGLGSSWKAGGRIAFLNTLGGSVGAFLASYFLILNLGLTGTLKLALALNVIPALIAILIFVFKTKPISDIQHLANTKVKPNHSAQKHSLQVIIGLAVSGFCGMGMEILWMRAFGLLVGSTVYSFSLVLTVILLGLALGGIIVDLFGEKISDKAFGWLFFLWALIILVGQVFLTKLPYLEAGWFKGSYSSLVSFQIMRLFFVALITLIPSIISGMVFPQAIVLLKDNFNKAGLKSGFFYFSNTIGAIFGGFLAATIILPRLGLQSGMSLLALIAFVTFLVIARSFRLSLLIGSLSLILVSAGFGYIVWDKLSLTEGIWYYGPLALSKTTGVKLLSYQDGIEGTVTTHWFRGHKSLLINGKIYASDENDLSTQILSGLLPMLLHQNPKQVLVIGFGSGITGGAVTSFDQLEKLTIVEIEKAVVDAAGKLFAEENSHVLDNPKTNLVINDARNFLLETNQKFDVITSEPNNIWSAGTANLFTKEFFTIGKERLSDDGIFLQWLHSYNLGSDQFNSIIATYNQVFPYVQIWTGNNGSDFFLVGKNQPFDLSFQQISQRSSQKSVQDKFNRLGIDNPLYFFRLFWSSHKKVVELTKNSPINTDLNPTLEFKAPLALFDNTKVNNYTLLSKYFDDDIKDLSLDDLTTEQTNYIEKSRLGRLQLLKARYQLETGNLNKAIELGEDKLNEDSQFPARKAFLSEAHFEKGVISKDPTHFEKSIKLDPQNYPAYLSLLNSYFQSKENDKLLTLSKKAEKLFPWSGEVLVYQGILKSQEGDNSEAEKILIKARDLEPWNPPVHNNLGLVYDLQDKKDLAKREWQSSLNLEPNQPLIKQLLEKK